MFVGSKSNCFCTLTLPPFMQKIHHFTRGLILAFIDLVYPLFKRLMPLQTFRYAACGGFNTSLDICLYIISLRFFFITDVIHPFVFLPHFNISAHIAAFLVGFSVTFPIGFYLSRYVVFQETTVRKSKQLVKYFSVVLFCLILNYGFLKLFVDTFRWDPIISKLITTVFVVTFSYVAQKNFTFTPNAIGALPEEES